MDNAELEKRRAAVERANAITMHQGDTPSSALVSCQARFARGDISLAEFMSESTRAIAEEHGLSGPLA